MTENVSSLRSVKVATPPCAANAAIPYVLAVRKRFCKPFAASKFGKTNTENQPLTVALCEKVDGLFYPQNQK